MRSTTQFANRSPSMSTPTLAFGAPKCSRPRQSTFVRPQLGPPVQSTSMCASRTRQGRVDRGARRRPGRASASRRVGVPRAVEAGVEVEQLRDEHADAPGAAQLFGVVVADQRLVRDVEADHRRVEALGEDALRRLRVGPDVELGRGCPVSLADRTAHQDDALRTCVGMLGEQQPDVRERPGRDERQASGTRAELLREEADGVPGTWARRRRRQLRAVEPGFAVDVRCDVARPDEGPVGAHVHRDVGAADELEEAERVVRRLVDSLVAADGRHADEVDLRRREREKQRHRVVVTGVAVEDDRDRRHRASMASTSAAVGADGCAPASSPRVRLPHRRGAGPRRAGVPRAVRPRGGRETVARGSAVDRFDLRRRCSRDLGAVLESAAPSAPYVTATSLPRETISRSRRLTISRSGSSSIGRAGAALSAKKSPLGLRRRRGVGDLELGEDGTPGRGRRDLCVRARDDDDLVLAGRVDEDQRDPGRAGACERELDAGGLKPGERLVGVRILADGADHPDPSSESRRRDGLVRALASGEAVERGARRASPRTREAARPARRGRG